jgi:hypothetical protein
VSSVTSIQKIQTTPPIIKSDANVSKVESKQNLQNNSSLSPPLNTSTIHPVQNNSTNQSTKNNSTNQPTQNSSFGNGLIIGLSISAAVIMAGVIIFAKIQRGKKNAR